MSLASDIADYRDNELRTLRKEERFFKTLSFAAAVEYAASGAGPHRGIHAHQRRIGVKRLRQGATLMKRHLPEIRKAKSFADLFVITESVKADLHGLGNLWSYDTASRMAFHRGKSFYPQTVFVHAGVRKGVKKIFSKVPIKGRTLARKVFPKEIQGLKPFEIENFLCVWGKRK